ncbi:ESPR domain-containing protein [Caballeronia telluris]
MPGIWTVNRIYKTVWNQVTRTWTATSELAKGHTK